MTYRYRSNRDLPEPIPAEMTLTLWEGEFVFPLLFVMKNNESLDGLSLLVSYENRRFEVPLTNMDEALKSRRINNFEYKNQSDVPVLWLVKCSDDHKNDSDNAACNALVLLVCLQKRELGLLLSIISINSSS